MSNLRTARIFYQAWPRIRLKPLEASDKDKQQQLLTDTKAQKTAVQETHTQQNKVHEVKEGDTLSAIAKVQGKTLDEILSIPGNEGFKDNPDKINVDDKVKLPAKDTEAKGNTTSQDSNSQANSGEVKSQKNPKVKKTKAQMRRLLMLMK